VRALVWYTAATHLGAATRAHDGAEVSDDRTTLAGEAGRARVLELLGLADASVIEAAPGDAATELAPAARRLIRYAVRPSVVRG
jgi:hypothetical protein